jgi:transcriptional regulator with XRE-family HTH domain
MATKRAARTLRRGPTQEDLADRAGLSARYLGSIERATVSASVTILGRLAQADELPVTGLPMSRAQGPDPL